MFCSKSCRITKCNSQQPSAQLTAAVWIKEQHLFIAILHNKPASTQTLLSAGTRVCFHSLTVLTSQFYPAALTHESSVTFSLLFRDKAYWASSSHSFFLLHASSGCPPLSTCADPHHTPARKRRLTTRETLAHTACVFVTGGCDGSMWRLLFSWALLCDLCAV